MSLTTTNHNITKNEAVRLVTNYCNNVERLGNNTVHQKAGAEINLFFSDAFNKAAIMEILNQPECIGIRAYMGMDDGNNAKLIIVGVDRNENDYNLNPGNAKVSAIMQDGFMCPPNCKAPDSSILVAPQP